MFQAKSTFNTKQGSFTYFRLSRLEELGIAKIDRLPFSIRILLENALRCCDEFQVSKANVEAIAGWSGTMTNPPEIPFKPARVILQDFTGVPAVVDLAAMRAAMARLGGDPKKINPVVPVDLVIDHSVQVDNFGTGNSLDLNVDLEFSRNRERYEFLRWGQKAFENFRIVPPATGIVHQVNLEYLATGVFSRRADGTTYAYPDTLVGTDSHTTMINALGVVGWGVGGIEAEAVMLDQPIYMLLPEVIGFELTGKLPSGATATDLVLTVTSMLRSKGVVGKFVEFYGSGLSQISLADRATIANMAPEYGATMGFFPVDAETIRFLARTGRPDETTELVEAYCKAQHLFRTDATPNPDFTDTLSLDMATVEPSLAGPKRPQDRVSLSNVANSFKSALTAGLDKRGFALNEEQLHKKAPVKADEPYDLEHGSVVIAAITSCTNTSNPSVMLGAGLLAKKAVEKGLEAKPWVKTSLAPGSRVVTNYLEASGTASALDQLGFQTVGYGCTTCIGNSGPLPVNVSKALSTNTDIVAASVLSGNRNFEGRVHPQVKANYLASPPLVVAFALAGRIDIDFNKEPVGTSKDGVAVYLKDIWPTAKEVEEAIEKFVTPTAFRSQYASVFEGDHRWQAIPIPEGQLFQFDSKSTYIQEPPFFGESFGMKPKAIGEIRGARCLALLGDSITTDHISPAGSIKKDSPAGKFLTENGVKPDDFNSYGARRGNDRVMTRGTFATSVSAT